MSKRVANRKGKGRGKGSRNRMFARQARILARHQALLKRRQQYREQMARTPD